ncbi:MAG: D-alanyl-D-alanine carboxypeptidase family protein [Bacillota bacterium]
MSTVLRARWKALQIVSAIIIAVAAAAFRPSLVVAAPSPPAVHADAAILMDLRTGQVLYSMRPDAREYPASTTKILTGIIALELGRLDDLVTVNDDVRKADGTSIYLEPGEQETLRDLLYAMFLNSANDAAVAVADYIAGNTTDFARLMNAVAAKAGATKSNFVNPNGLVDKNHYTTARDLALIARYAMHNPTFAAMVSTRTHDMPWPEKDDERHLYNQNHFLTRYEYATGVKPGYTTQAKDTLVASASKDGIDLVAVIMRANGGGIWTDAERLMDYGFAVAKKTVEAVPPGDGLVAAAAKELGIQVAQGPTPPVDPGPSAPTANPRPVAGPVWRGAIKAGLTLAALFGLSVWAVRRPRARRRPRAAVGRRPLAIGRVSHRGRTYVHRSLYRWR